jgi:tRNA uridine 5-carboxymethylaminomethyl modification enzyme
MFHVKPEEVSARRKFDVIVIGGGHAGCEAAAASARCGAVTALITNRFSTIGEMSCNPAIGGLGKGHLVRIIDALDGLMPRAVDAAAVQFRVLTRRKSPAVQGPRAQADRSIYRRAMQALIVGAPNLAVIEREAAQVFSGHGVVQGLELTGGHTIHGLSLVIATGTFLRAVIHLGDTTMAAGRFALARSLGVAGLALARLKTGTPPRIDGGKIDWAGLDVKMATAPQSFFVLYYLGGRAPTAVPYDSNHPENPPDRALELISLGGVFRRDFRSRPEILPSIEDKAVRFSDRGSH